MSPRQEDELSAAAQIDALLAADKELAGVATWVDGNNSDDKRIRWPILVGGRMSAAQLALTAYPNAADPSFTISLIQRTCVWRLDFDPPYRTHDNPIDRAHLLGAARVRGPHYHAWADNRHLATAASLPKTLDCARELPKRIRQWEQAFRWFCAQTKISFEPSQLIGFPPREGLL
ncbi:MAG TPA: hypothetical protein VMF53_04475 [Alphaproteobacteria bacterium]|nr:hypothetical protein [Alphaproteobacteria bacterium]